MATGYPMHISIIGEGTALVDHAFHSVVDNLVRNAMKPSKAQNVTIALQDDGKGIEESIRDKIFNEGFSHGETKGTGLGLFIVARTMDRYKGTIKVRSNSPKGTVFDLTFPSAR